MPIKLNVKVSLVFKTQVEVPDNVVAQGFEAAQEYARHLGKEQYIEWCEGDQPYMGKRPSDLITGVSARVLDTTESQ